MKFSIHKKVLLFFILSLPFFTNGQIQLESVEKYAKQCIENYVLYLNQIGNLKERRWLDDDIKNTIKDSFNGADSSWVYDNIKSNQDSIRLKDYLKKISSETEFPNGVKFDYDFRDFQVCRIEQKDTTAIFDNPYYRAKLYCIVDYKTKEGKVRQDHIDIFVRFDIQSNIPLKVNDRPYIIKSKPHIDEPCPKFNTNKVDCFMQANILDETDKQLLRTKAEVIVREYASALNSIDEKNFDSEFKILDYFDRKNVKVIFDDLTIETGANTITYTPAGYIKAFQAVKKKYLNKYGKKNPYLDYYFVEGGEILDPILSESKLFNEYFIVRVQVFRKLKISQYPLNTRKLIFDVKFPIKDCQIDFDRKATKIMKISPYEVKKQPVYYWRIGGGAGLMGYFGDINPFMKGAKKPFSLMRSSINIEASKKVSSHWHIRLGLAYGQIKGDDFTHSDFKNDEQRFLRNLHFKNNILELSTVGLYDWKAFDRRFFRRRRFVPYSFAGFAVLLHNPKAKSPENFGRNWETLRTLKTEGQDKPYSRIQMAIPFGLGIKVKLSERLDLNLEANFRYSFTDYLDDVSGNYAEIGDLSSDLAKAMSNRSNEEVTVLENKDRRRQLENIERISGEASLPFVSTDGKSYQSYNGHGKVGTPRGNSKGNDMYYSLGFKISYFIKTGNSFKKQFLKDKRKQALDQKRIDEKIQFQKTEEELNRLREERRNGRTDDNKTSKKSKVKDKKKKIKKSKTKKKRRDKKK